MTDMRRNYRVLRTRADNLELVEVIYVDGSIADVVRQPLFSAYVHGGETKDDIVRELRRAHQDARDKPIIEEADL